MSFFNPNIFRVDEKALRKEAEAELSRTLQEVVQLQKIQDGRDASFEPIPLIESFPLYHKTKSFVGGEAITDLIRVDVPKEKVGFLSAIGTSYLLASPNSWFEIEIDDKPIDGYSEADGKITRQIGDLLIPRPLIPPLVFYRKAVFRASNEKNTGVTATMGYTIEGILMDKPKFVGEGAIISSQGLLKFIRKE